MSRQIHYILVLCILSSACDRREDSKSGISTETASIASARDDETMLREEIGKGLEEYLNVISIPSGEIEIMSGLSSQMEANNFQSKRFKSDYLSFLDSIKSNGLLTYAEKPQSALEEVGRVGAKTFVVSPTELALQHRDQKLSTADYVQIRIATCKVESIIRSTPYESPRLPQSEEYRLVLGTYYCKGIPWARDAIPGGKDDTFKFRAVLKLNPFTKRYTFQFADWGYPIEDGWKSNNVE
jgi:hypothetical protein